MRFCARAAKPSAIAAKSHARPAAAMSRIVITRCATRRPTVPPHNLARIEPQRTLVDVLRDVTEARRDLTDAEQSSDADAIDRMLEAEQRLHDLREEFSAEFVLRKGLTVERLREAFAEAVI
jgi:hypothetical protein